MLVDTAAYYAAFRQAAVAARHGIFLVGWDVDSRTILVPRQEHDDGHPRRLLDFLEAMLARRPELQVFALAWDFSMIYLFERELFTRYKFRWGTDPRMHFALDEEHPPGASQHQKLAVIDDQVAFTGGMDLTIRRWDTPEHRAQDARRRDPEGELYAPVHDVQIGVDGQAARALAELARARWRHATGMSQPEPPRVEHASSDPWPSAARVDFQNVDVGISRTGPALDGTGGRVREIERLIESAIAAARRSIYIESQYLTSSVVADALSRRLGEQDGPEVIAVLPKFQQGWLEQGSMGVLRRQTLSRLRAADRNDRLRVCYPHVAELAPDACVNLHSKLLVVDDRLIKIGSANLSNRSMGLDTECDLAIDAVQGGRDRADVRAAIRGVVQRLLAEHLSLSAAQVAAELDAGTSLRALIDSRRGRSRCLEPLIEMQEPPVDLTLLGGMLTDPEQPMDPESFVERFVAKELPRKQRALRRILRHPIALGLAASAAGITALTLHHRHSSARSRGHERGARRQFG